MKLRAFLVIALTNFKGHSDRVWEAAFSPDGEVLASGSVDGTVKIWQKKDGRIVRVLEHPAGITSLAFSPDGGSLATSGYDSNVRLWRAADGAVPKTFPGDSKPAAVGQSLKTLRQASNS